MAISITAAALDRFDSCAATFFDNSASDLSCKRKDNAPTPTDDAGRTTCLQTLTVIIELTTEAEYSSVPPTGPVKNPATVKPPPRVIRGHLTW